MWLILFGTDNPFHTFGWRVSFTSIQHILVHIKVLTAEWRWRKKSENGSLKTSEFLHGMRFDFRPNTDLRGWLNLPDVYWPQTVLKQRWLVLVLSHRHGQWENPLQGFTDYYDHINIEHHVTMISHICMMFKLCQYLLIKSLLKGYVANIVRSHKSHLYFRKQLSSKCLSYFCNI